MFPLRASLVLLSLSLVAGPSAATAQFGTLITQAVLDGSPWSSSDAAPVSYRIVGPAGTLSGTSGVPSMITALPAGSYTITYDDGGPPNSFFVGVSPCWLTISFSNSCSVSLAENQALSLTLQFVSDTQLINFTEAFNNAPDYTNNWHISPVYDSGTTSLTYTSGNFLMYASYSAPAGSSIGLASNLTFANPIDVTFQFNHQGYGRTSVGIWSPITTGFIAEADLDTDANCHLTFVSGTYSTQTQYSCTPYMNRLLPIRLQVLRSKIRSHDPGRTRSWRL